MSPSNGLDSLIDYSERQRDDAASQLGSLIGRRERESEQYESLCNYRAEYRRRMDELMLRGARFTELENFRRFLGSLDRAIEQQRANLEEAEHRVDRGRLDLQEGQRQVSSFHVLSDRRRQSERQRADRLEQAAMDEIAQRTAHPLQAGGFGS